MQRGSTDFINNCGARASAEAPSATCFIGDSSNLPLRFLILCGHPLTIGHTMQRRGQGSRRTKKFL